MADKNALMLLTALAKTQPTLRSTGNHQHFSTLRRWSTRGVKIGSQVIKLEVTWQGSRLCSSVAALERFHERCNSARRGEQIEYMPEQVPAVQSRGHQRAVEFLEAAGI